MSPSFASLETAPVVHHSDIDGRYKAELIHRTARRINLEAVDLAALQWVRWFNRRRLMVLIDCIRLAEAEDNLYRQQERHAPQTAQPRPNRCRDNRGDLRVLQGIRSGQRDQKTPQLVDRN